MTHDSYKFIVLVEKGAFINPVFAQSLRAVSDFALLKDTVEEACQMALRSEKEVSIIMREINIQSIHEKPSRGFYGVLPFKFCAKVAWLVAVLLAFTVNPAAADELFMKNGDRLQGKVIAMSFGKLIFETSYAGKITIDWDQVDRLTTEGTVEVYLRDEKTIKGKVVTTKEGQLLVEPEDGTPTEPITVAQVKSLELPKPPEEWEYHIRIAAGANNRTGNTNKYTANLNGTVTVHKFPHDIILYGEYYKEMKKKILVEDNALGTLTYKRFLNRKWFLFGKGLAQMDKFEDLNFLGSLSAGPGYQVWKSREKNLSFSAGPGYTIERYTKPMVNFGGKSYRNYVSGVWNMDFNMWFFKRFLQVFHHNDGIVDLRDANNWRIITRTGVRIPIVLRFFTSLQFNYDWANSPADGKTKYDQGVIFNFGWGL